MGRERNLPSAASLGVFSSCYFFSNLTNLCSKNKLSLTASPCIAKKLPCASLMSLVRSDFAVLIAFPGGKRDQHFPISSISSGSRCSTRQRPKSFTQRPGRLLSRGLILPLLNRFPVRLRTRVY